MEIKEPKFREGQKVIYVEDRNIYTVESINSYSFKQNEYSYDLVDRLCTLPESKLELYIEKPKSVWDLKEGDTYYSINGNGSVSSEKKWFDDEYENNYREIGNVFLTKEEVEFEVERRRIETKMLRLGGRRKFKHNGDNYGIDYCEGLGITLYHYKFLQGLIYFDTLKETEDAIKTIGKDRIKKYLFRSFFHIYNKK